MAENLRISVIIPAYNVAPYLENTLGSMGNQSFSSFEIILIDDGSQDETLAVARKTLATSSRPFRIFTQENQGVGKTRNRGLQEARGKYLLFFDGDDLAEPELLEKLYRQALSQEADTVFCGYDEVIPSGEVQLTYRTKFRYLPSPLAGEKACAAYLRHEIWPFIGSTLIRKTLLEKESLRFLERCISAEDIHFIARALFASPRVASVPQVLTHHLERPRSLVSHTGLASRRPGDAYGAYKGLYRFLKDRGASPALLEHLEKQQISNALSNILSMFVLTDREEHFHQLLEHPETKRILRKSLSLGLTKPKIFLRSAQLLWHPQGFVRYYRKKRNRNS
jgi:glycosyltransferase involved in cell wall biosynthesis